MFNYIIQAIQVRERLCYNYIIKVYVNPMLKSSHESPKGDSISGLAHTFRVKMTFMSLTLELRSQNVRDSVICKKPVMLPNL